MFVLAPGYKTPPIPLNEAMTTARNDRVAKHEHEKAKRKKRGTPQSDNVDYEALATVLGQASEAAKTGDDDTVYTLMQDAGDFLAPSVRAPEPFEPRPEWDGIRVVCTLLSREAWVDGRFEAMRQAAKGDTEPLKKLLGQCFEVSGIQVEGDISGPDLWSHANLTGALLQVADYFQTVDFDAKKHFGSQMP